MLFIVAILAWWGVATLTWRISSPGEFAWIAFWGSFYAVPVAIFAALVELSVAWLARPLLCFVALAALGILLCAAVLQFGPGAPSNKVFHSAESAWGFGRMIGLPTLAVIVVYMAFIAMRSGLSRTRGTNLEEVTTNG
jgi:hypothetical protein